MKSQLKRSEYTLTENEIRSIINNTMGFRDRLIIKCLYYGGMRAHEVTKLLIESVDHQRKVITVIGKFNKLRAIPILDLGYLTDIKHYLGQRIKGFVFLSNRCKPMTVRNVEYIVSRAATKASIVNPNPLMSHVNPHMFRHSIARHLKDKRYPLEFIQKFLGHASSKTTADTYGTLSLHEMQKLIARETGDINLLDDNYKQNRLIN